MLYTWKGTFVGIALHYSSSGDVLGKIQYDFQFLCIFHITSFLVNGTGWLRERLEVSLCSKRLTDGGNEEIYKESEKEGQRQRESER